MQNMEEGTLPDNESQPAHKYSEIAARTLGRIEYGRECDHSPFEGRPGQSERRA